MADSSRAEPGLESYCIANRPDIRRPPQHGYPAQSQLSANSSSLLRLT